MRWPSFSDPFRRCCGLREGKRGSNYDAWLARERLNQVKRLEMRLADLAHENASLAAQLGKAVNVMDSYHNFDLAALQSAGSIPDDRSDHSRQSGSRALGGSISRQSVDMQSQTSRGRSGSLAPRSRAESLAARDQSLGGRRSQAKVGSLPAAHLALPAPPAPAIPERLLRIGVPPSVANAPVVGRAPSPQARAERRAGMVDLSNIPSAQELDALLSRNAPGRRPRRRPTVPLASSENMSRASSAALPPVSSLAYMAAVTLAEGKAAAGRSSLEAQPDDASTNSFTFSPSGRLQGTLPPVSEEPETPVTKPARPGIMVERRQPAAGEAPVPVQDGAMLATQARGQIYSGHYTAETSPFARAAARMPGPDGSSPLRARPKAATTSPRGA